MPIRQKSIGANRVRGAYRRRVVTALLLGAVLILGGCTTTTIVPPPSPQAPATVLLLDHGLHASLVLPDETGRAVRYSYGDWDYYALGETGWRNA